MTKMQYGSFVFEHNPRRIELSAANGIAAHFLPSHGAVSQYLGNRSRVVRCEGEVFGATAAAAITKLSAISALCNIKSEMLYLPTGERFTALISRFSYGAQGDGRVLSYALEFVEQDTVGAGGGG